MINSLVLLAVAVIPMLLLAEQTSKPTNPDVAPMTLTGCLRSDPADPNNAADKRVIYTLVVAKSVASDRSGAAGTSGRAQAPEGPQKVQLSTAEAKALAKHVGKEVQVTGELLQPPGLPPAAAAKATPLPGDAEGTFRVSSVRPVASKCR
jgi:hypothetical protein